MDVGWELPLFSSDLEPQELKRLRCCVCQAAWADVQCHRCHQQFCHACETVAHAAVSDPAAHLSESEPCNVCQDCQMKGPDLFCRDCERYQCDLCCAAVHASDDAMRRHIRIATEGAPIALMHHSVWDTLFVDHAKMARRRQQHATTQTEEIVKQEVGALPDYLPLSPHDDDDSTSEEGDLPSGVNDDAAEVTRREDAVQIKLERVHLHDRPVAGAQVSNVPERQTGSAPSVETPPLVQVKTERVDRSLATAHHAMGGDGQPPTLTPPPPPPQGPIPPVEVKTERVDTAPRPPPVPSPVVDVKTERVLAPSVPRRTSTQHEIVDLTGDDDDDDDDAQTVPNQASATSTHVKAEPTMASVAPASAMPLSSPLGDEDLIRSAMIREYTTLSQQLVDAEQQRTALSQRAASSGSMQDIAACQQQLAVLKNTVMKLTHSRTAAVARLLFYVHGGDVSAAWQSGVALDIPDAQAAFHRRLRDLDAAITREAVALDAAKRQMDEAVAMKAGDAYAEVLRLGHEISERETQLRALETQRLNSFRQLAHVSDDVRRATLALVVETDPSPPANAPRAL